MRSPSRLVPIVVAIGCLLVMVSLGAVSARAQETNATPSPMMGMEMAHPAHIHDGTCATLGAVKWPLTDVSADGLTMMGTPAAGTPMAMATPTMAMSASPMAGMGTVVAASTTTVQVALADLEAAPYAVNVHESTNNIATYIACGDITGAITDGSLTITLNELNTSGFWGTAMLHDNGDGTTTVTIQLMQAMS
jgi:hypothetical protein